MPFVSSLATKFGIKLNFKEFDCLYNIFCSCRKVANSKHKSEVLFVHPVFPNSVLTVSLLEKIGLSTFSSSQSERKKADLSVYPNQKERQKSGFICLSVYKQWFIFDSHCQTANKQCYKEHFDQNIRSCPLGGEISSELYRDWLWDGNFKFCLIFFISVVSVHFRAIYDEAIRCQA